jgi:hypothetical protein
MSPRPDPDERRRRRALLKAHHPDLGGDSEEFIRVVAAMQTGRSTASGDEVRFAHRPRGLARIAARYRTWRRRRNGPSRVR